jgi:hypothetical protein
MAFARVRRHVVFAPAQVIGYRWPFTSPSFFRVRWQI